MLWRSPWARHSLHGYFIWSTVIRFFSRRAVGVNALGLFCQRRVNGSFTPNREVIPLLCRYSVREFGDAIQETYTEHE